MDIDTGAIILGGSFASVNGAVRSNLAKLDSSGNLDDTFIFNTNGTVHTIKSYCSSGNCSIFLGGEFTSVSGKPKGRVARINNTTLQTVDFQADATVRAIDYLNGPWVMAGDFSSIGGAARDKVALFFDDNSLVTDFNPQVSTPVKAIDIQSDGKILVAGEFAYLGGKSRGRIGRLQSDGSIDESFADAKVDGVIH